MKVRKLYSKPVIIILIITIFILAKASWGVYEKERESRGKVAMVKAELESLEKRLEHLKKETDKLDTEEGVEDAIRKKFQVSKPGESVLVVVDKPLPAEITEEDDGFFSKMWNSMSGIFKGKPEEGE